ncbi:MAG: MerC domain-containing protein [Akkermansiaceae bacterium]
MTNTCLTIKNNDSQKIDPDRIGVIASVLCAVHCLLTPLLIVSTPSFSRMWAHPASHWIVALIVIPIAAYMLFKGYRIHQRKWILACGVSGIMLILIGAVIPYSNLTNQGIQIEHYTSWETLWSGSGNTATFSQNNECADSCCPSLVAGTDSNKIGLHIPLASIVTTLGGIALIATHLGNICYFRRCKTCEPKA